MLDPYLMMVLGNAKSKYSSMVKECEAAKREREEVAAAPGMREDLAGLLVAVVPSRIDTPMALMFGKGLEKAVSETALALQGWLANAQPLKYRQERLANLDSRIADLEQQISKMRADARAAGVILG